MQWKPGCCTKSAYRCWHTSTISTCAPSWEYTDRTTSRTSRSQRVLDCLVSRLCCYINISAESAMLRAWTTPNAVLSDELRKGKGDRSSPRKHHKDQLKQQLVNPSVGHNGWQTFASNRVPLRPTIKHTAQQLEGSRVNTAKKKCERRKESANQASNVLQQSDVPNSYQ